MIYLFSGDDTKKKTKAYESLVKSLPKETEVLLAGRGEIDPVQIESFYSGSSLFSPVSAVVFHNTLEKEEVRDFVLDKLNLMGKSDNSFIFLEGKLNKSVLDAFKKARAEINVLELPKEKKEKFDSFLLANAFARKDRLNLWIYFRQALERGVAMEELIGVLFWKIKDMILKRDTGNFSEAELKNFASRLSYLLPEARKNGRDAESAFEKFLLEAF